MGIFNIETPVPGDPTLSMLFFGLLKPSSKPGYVWLANFGGEAILEVEQASVHPVTAMEAAEIVAEEAKLQRKLRGILNE